LLASSYLPASSQDFQALRRQDVDSHSTRCPGADDHGVIGDGKIDFEFGVRELEKHVRLKYTLCAFAVERAKFGQETWAPTV
jgi:hypothetical protein